MLALYTQYLALELCENKSQAFVFTEPGERSEKPKLLFFIPDEKFPSINLNRKWMEQNCTVNDIGHVMVWFVNAGEPSLLQWDDKGLFIKYLLFSSF